MSQRKVRSIKPSLWNDTANLLRHLGPILTLGAKAAYCVGKYGVLIEYVKKEIGGYFAPRGQPFNPPKEIVENEIVMQCSQLPRKVGSEKGECPFKNNDYETLRKERNQFLKREIKSIDDYDVEGEVDVCIIGTGPGGSAAAYALSQRYKEELEKGAKKIVMLERGSLFTSDEFNQKEASMLPKLLAPRFSDDFGVLILKGRLIGGTAVVNDGVCFEAPAPVTKEWEVDVGHDLRDQRFYRKVREMIRYKKIPHMAQHKNARMFEKGIAEEDKEFYLLNERNTNAKVDSQPSDPQHQLACVGSGMCHLGCRDDRKQSPLITYVPAAMANGVRVFKNAIVSEVLHRNGVAEGVRVKRGLLRSDLVIKAKKVIVSGGAINSPQLLLASGIDNRHLGKHISLHPSPLIFAVFDEDVYPDWGIPMTSCFEKFQFPQDNKDVFPDGFGYIIETFANHPAIQALSYPRGSIKEKMKKYKRTACVTVIVHDKAVGEVGRRHGRLTPLTYKLDEQDKIKLKHGMKESIRIFLQAGAKEVFTSHEKETVFRSLEELEKIDCLNKDHLPVEPGEMLLISAHSQGGCRMGTSAEEGVVDFNGQSHDVKNLYVCDGSLFPTSLGVNPQVTIMALSTKIGEQIELAS